MEASAEAVLSVQDDFQQLPATAGFSLHKDPWNLFNVPKTVMELKVLNVLGAIYRKAQWMDKIERPELVEKWKTEAAAQSVPSEAIAYAIDEAKYVSARLKALYGSIRSAPSGEILFAPAGAESAYASYGDSFLQFCKEHEWPDSSRLAEEGRAQSSRGEGLTLDQVFRRAVEELQEHPEGGKPDWHPNSDEQVLDLVHPSLYCYVNGVTPNIKRDEGQSASKRETLRCLDTWRSLLLEPSTEVQKKDPPSRSSEHRYFYDDDRLFSNFQWLPADVDISSTGKVRFTSYINNLHPERHRKMYSCLEQIFAAALPGFERVLGGSASPVDRGIHPAPDGWWGDDDFSWSNHEEDEDQGNAAYEEWLENRPFVPPIVPDFGSTLSSPSSSTANVGYSTSNCLPKRISLKDRQLKVIVKLANIILTPEKPSYPGGTWHLEGTKNERIIATGIYYYDIKNITESKLSFRQAVSSMNIDYEQDDRRGVELMYGLVDDEPENQPLGHIVAEEGKFVVFPNTLQHKVEPFELMDKTRKGHRKILVFFLVDFTSEEVGVKSTSTVPPQQSEWVLREIFRSTPALRRLPEGIDRKIWQFADDYRMSRKDAEQYRLDLMKERMVTQEAVNSVVFEVPCSLCEH